MLARMDRAQGTRTDLTSGQAVEKLEYQAGVKICGGYKNAERWQLSGSVTDDEYCAWLDGLNGETFPTSAERWRAAARFPAAKFEAFKDKLRKKGGVDGY